MSVYYEKPSHMDGDEHVYSDVLPPTYAGNSESQLATISGNEATKGGNSTQAFQYIVLGINAVLLLALVGISVYCLQMPKPEVFCSSEQECQSFDTVLGRLADAETRLDKQNATLQESLTKTEAATSQKEPVVNGSWSQWGTWSTCSLTCGSGVTTRFRRCDSPAPSSTGRACAGDPMEAVSCNVKRCSEPAVNGNWSQWDEWSTCSLTCGSGVTTRFRRCDSLAPSSTGRDCKGDPMEAKSCNVERCPGNQSAFTATTPSSSGSNLMFTSVITNIGNNYNASTGRFACQYPGVYFFSVSITKIRNSNDAINDLVNVSINVNDDGKVTASIDPEDNSDFGSYETSATLTIRLSVGDVVNVQGSNSEQMENVSHFSGILIQSE